ncbi:MAG: YcfA family protein [Candidatus Amesbacteria bacterium GW2011_GWA1_46_35]|uniref:YcfA family protein n=1 Tax=Candidatus Amesbacteria bacterium GW2011_GWC2_45_19 TaxID=1618366 RepID=A0A0G1Q459_9BACT|nr:MAG: YcfA family protein [Candidatus Amesbacteria bacterium GW2011_GWC2_45_19]KKU37794.1 MAG: YcfA family protein [Candidatus Amesbacteria bacterium GW2011_GWA1_46_35]KKU69572.1 MAG: YcfA family protein [Microgenomates group bacterium GW2011_GWC1_47_20]
MSRLPSLKPREVLKILRQNGFVEKRQVGSHRQLFHPASKLRVTVPIHNRDLKRKTLISILRQAKVDI